MTNFTLTRQIELDDNTTLPVGTIIELHAISLKGCYGHTTDGIPVYADILDFSPTEETTTDNENEDDDTDEEAEE